MRPILLVLSLALASCSATGEAKTALNLAAEVGDVAGTVIERACIRSYDLASTIVDDGKRRDRIASIDVYCHPETGSAIRAHAKLAAVHAAGVATVLAVDAGVPCTDDAGRPRACDLEKVKAEALDAVRAIGQATSEVSR